MLFAIPALILALRVSGNLDPDPGPLFVAILATVVGVVAGFVLTGREALRCAEREMVFVLDGNGIIRKRKGFPDVRIAYSEVDTLGEELRWLVVKSIEPRRNIAIPNDVKGYEAIRGELIKHHALAAQARFPLRSAATMAMSVLSWAAVLWFPDQRVIIPAAVIALTLLALGSHRLWILLRRSQARWLSIVCLGFVWLTAALVIYLRVTHW